VLRITGTSFRARTQYRGDFVTALVWYYESVGG
jgi:hypothetical protein